MYISFLSYLFRHNIWVIHRYICTGILVYELTRTYVYISMHTYIHYMRKYMHACMHSGSLTPERLQSLQDRSEAPWMALPVECKTVIANLQAAPLVFIPTCRHTYIHTSIFSVVLISTYAGYIQVRMRRYAWHTYLSTHTHTHIYIYKLT